MQRNTTWLIILIALFLVLGVGLYLKNITRQGNITPLPTIATSLPKPESIHVNSPEPLSTVSNPITITGEARGSWYIEASFPIRIEDATGKNISTTTAHAQSDWMTTEFVSFQATIITPTSYTGSATLVLEKDNPSGLPQNDDSLRIPITIHK